MNDEYNFKNMSNNEIKLQMKSFENDYEATKAKMLELIEKMKKLDELFIKAKSELANRSKGIF